MQTPRTRSLILGIPLTLIAWLIAFFEALRVSNCLWVNLSMLLEWMFLSIHIVCAFYSFRMLYDFEEIENALGGFWRFAAAYGGIWVVLWEIVIRGCVSTTDAVFLVLAMLVTHIVLVGWIAPRGVTEQRRIEAKERLAELRSASAAREEAERREQQELAARPEHAATERERVLSFYADHLDILRDVTTLAALQKETDERLTVVQTCNEITANADQMVSVLNEAKVLIELEQLYSSHSPMIEEVYPRAAFDKDVGDARASAGTLLTRKVEAARNLINRLAAKLQPARDKAARERETAERERRADEERVRQQQEEQRQAERQRQAADRHHAERAARRAERRKEVERQVRADANGFSEAEILKEVLFRIDRMEDEELAS